jgi:hypothetical protein
LDFSIPPSVGMFPQQEEVMESAIREPQVATVLLQHEALEEPMTAVAGIPLQQEAVDVTQQEEIYMEQPRGFQVPESMNKVCKLLKSLYGLWQASRAWNPRFHKLLTDHNLEVSEADPCLCCDHSSPQIDDSYFC